jgi:Tat protein translocase TatB subunit
MFDIGIQELIVIFIVALLVFGPKRLPELGRSLGKGLAELKKAFQDVKDQVETEFKETDITPHDSFRENINSSREEETKDNQQDTDKKSV